MPLGADTGSGGANPTFDSSGHSERGVSKTRNGGPNPLGERLGPERNGRREATAAAVRGRFAMLATLLAEARTSPDGRS
jgi:hypothetical protein